MTSSALVLFLVAAATAAPRPDIADTLGRIIGASSKLQNALGDSSSGCLEPPPKLGVCRATFTRWAYNKATQSCQTYSWGGCGRTGNMFTSEADCKRTCASLLKKTPRCSGPLTCPKFCSVRINRSTGCKECVCKKQQPTRVPSGACSQPIKKGVCKAAFDRFAYNSVLGECRPFLYGGCGGNSNRFKTLHECQAACT